MKDFVAGFKLDLIRLQQENFVTFNEDDMGRKNRHICEHKRSGVVLRPFLLLNRDLLWDDIRPKEGCNCI